MTVLRTLVGATLALGLALAGALSVHLVQRSRPAPPAAPPPDWDEVRTELRLLRRQVEAVTRPRAVPHDSAAAEGPASPAAAVPSPAPTRESYSSEQQTRRVADELSAKQEREPVDGRWSEQTAAQIRKALEAAGLPIRPIDIRCASTLCRVILDHEEAATQSTLAEAIAETPPFDEDVFYHLDMGARPYRTTVFLSRKGYPLFERVPR